MKIEGVHPRGWREAKGYSNGILVEGAGRMLFIAGQVAWDADQQLVGPDDFTAQFRQALQNVVSVIEAAGGAAGNLAKMTIYVTDKRAYIESTKDIGVAWREVCGRHFPAMALVEVKALLEHGALVEIEAIAVLA